MCSHLMFLIDYLIRVEGRCSVVGNNGKGQTSLVSSSTIRRANAVEFSCIPRCFSSLPSPFRPSLIVSLQDDNHNLPQTVIPRSTSGVKEDDNQRSEQL